MALNGKTLAEIANIDLGLEGNRWLALINKAAQYSGSLHLTVGKQKAFAERT